MAGRGPSLKEKNRNGELVKTQSSSSNRKYYKIGQNTNTGPTDGQSGAGSGGARKPPVFEPAPHRQHLVEQRFLDNWENRQKKVETGVEV